MPDPFADYRFTTAQLTKVYDRPEKPRKEVAHVFFGEWMKLLPEPARDGQVHVKFRGGSGWVEEDRLGADRKLEMFFIDVGQGDAILVQTPDDRRILVDGGPGGEALEFLRNKYRLDKAENAIDLEAVVLTHSDEDHAEGIIPILQHPQIGVKRVLHNGLFPGLIEKRGDRARGLVEGKPPAGHPELKPLMKRLAAAIEDAGRNLPGVIAKMRAAGRRADLPEGGFACRRADFAEGRGFVEPFAPGASPVAVQILWPESAAAGGASYPWFADEGKTKNGNSVVLRLTYGKFAILLAGDLNRASMAEVAKARGRLLDATVYKAAHHGSQDFDVGFLRAVAPDVGIVSSGDDAYSQYGHPRGVLLGTLTRYSKSERPGVFATELARCFAPLQDEELARFRKGEGELYEKAIEGVIHLRSDGEQLHVGRVFGRAMPRDRNAATTWKWDVWPDLKSED
jgi:beta-lactamase superfamily II metal-dependent hydrolase